MYALLVLQAQGAQAAGGGSDKSIVESIKALVTDPQHLVDFGAKYGGQLLLAIVILVVGRWISKAISRAVRKVISKKAEATLSDFAGSLIYMLLMTLVVLVTLDTIGVKTTSFAAILAAAGFAVGFALQGSLSNFAAGVMIMLFRPFKAGDYVEAGGTAGAIVEIGVFSTIFKTPDNKRIIVPNAAVTGSNIVNYSAHDTRRVDLVFGIGYEDDLRAAKSLLERIVKEHEKVLDDPAPVVAVSELADSSVNLVCRPWVKTTDYWEVYWNLIETVKLQFDANGISIPFPQRDVHLHQVG